MSALSRWVSPGATRSASVRAGQAGLFLGGAAAALLIAFVLVDKGARFAVAPLLVVPAAWAVTRKPGGLLVGLTLVLALPYWLAIGTAQTTVLRLASVAAIIGFLVARRPRLCMTDYALATFVAIFVLGWLLQYDEPYAGSVVAIALTPLGFYLGARAVAPERVHKVTKTILFAGTVGALTVLYEWVRGASVFVDPSRYLWNANSTELFRPGGVFGSAPGAGAVLCFVILFGFAALTTLRGKARIFGMVCIAVDAFALVITFTRADLIGAGVGIIVYLRLVRSPLLRPLRVAWAIAAVTAIVILALPSLQRSATFQQGIVRPGNLQGRINYWNWALPIATASPHNFIFGLGTATLETPSIGSNALVPGSIAQVPVAFEHSLHSQYVTTLIEQGVIGLGALVCFLLLAFLSGARAARFNPAGAAVAASVIAFAIMNAAGTDFLHGPSFAMLMVASGIGASLQVSAAGIQESAGRRKIRRS